MSYLREKFVSTAMLVLGLCLAPVAFGQAQTSGAAAAPAQNAGQARASGSSQAQAPAQAKAAPASAEPQLQDQSAPQDQSLGAIARQAKAQKAKSEPAKVYTEDKLSGLSGRGVSSVGSGNSGGGGSYGGNTFNNAGAGGSGQSLGSNESYWRGRANGIRGQMAQLDAQIAGIREEIKKKGAVTVDPMSGASAGVIYIEDRNRQIQQVEAQKGKLQQSLEDLAEEGRKAGADSGWFR
jgi:hypothetical protein